LYTECTTVLEDKPLSVWLVIQVFTVFDKLMLVCLHVVYYAACTVNVCWDHKMLGIIISQNKWFRMGLIQFFLGDFSQNSTASISAIEQVKCTKCVA